MFFPGLDPGTDNRHEWKNSCNLNKDWSSAKNNV